MTGNSGQETPRRRPRRNSLSREAVLAALIARLDADGAEKVTLRGIAADLNTGAASLYWYAANKDELLAMASAELIGRAIAAHRATPPARGAYRPHPRTSSATVEAIATIRTLAAQLFEQMLAHPWLPQLLLGQGGDSREDLEFWNLIGEQLMRTELTARQQFHASAAIINMTVSTGIEFAYRRHAFGTDPDTLAHAREDQIARWQAEDLAQLPFIAAAIDVLGTEDDTEAFLAHIDLLLAGVERQSWREDAEDR